VLCHVNRNRVLLVHEICVELSYINLLKVMHILHTLAEAEASFLLLQTFNFFSSLDLRKRNNSLLLLLPPTPCWWAYISKSLKKFSGLLRAHETHQTITLTTPPARLRENEEIREAFKQKFEKHSSRNSRSIQAEIWEAF